MLMATKKISPQEVADIYGVKTCTLALALYKVGPRYAKLGSRVMYDIEDPEDWFASRCVHYQRFRPSMRKR
jgi:hypothetical protein